jgi:hypothetical protein
MSVRLADGPMGENPNFEARNNVRRRNFETVRRLPSLFRTTLADL